MTLKTNLYNGISVELSEETMAEVKAAFALINDKLSFLVSLTNDEKQACVKLGAKSIDFVIDAEQVANNYAKELPQNFDAESIKKARKLHEQMNELKMMADNLSEKLNDTSIAAGHEAMRTSLNLYNFIKAAARYQPGMKTIAGQLKERFKVSRKAKSNTTITSTKPPTP